MSAEIPEVGDVFAEKLKNDKGYLKHRVIAVNNLYVVLAKEVVERWGDVELKTIVTGFLNKKALTRMKYLGNSKTRIEDLFEVEQNLTIEDYIERIDDWLLKN